MLEVFAVFPGPSAGSGTLLYIAFPLVVIWYFVKKKRRKLTAKNEKTFKEYFLFVLAITIVLLLFILELTSNLNS